MIPIRDTLPRRNFPIATLILIVINALVFFVELSLPPPALEQCFRLFGIVPARFTHPEWALWSGFPIDTYWPFLTSMFLHGGWLHIIGNMWALWIVPHYAMSGGTLIALAANEIVMSQHAVLGPVDPQLGEFAAASILKAVAKKPVAEVDDETLIKADQAEKAIAQLRESVRELLADKIAPDKVDELSRKLSEGTWTHDYPITFETAKSFGLPVRSDISPELLDLMNLFPQPVRRQPSVEYLREYRRFKPAPQSR